MTLFTGSEQPGFGLVDKWILRARRAYLFFFRTFKKIWNMKQIVKSSLLVSTERERMTSSGFRSVKGCDPRSGSGLISFLFLFPWTQVSTLTLESSQGIFPATPSLFLSAASATPSPITWTFSYCSLQIGCLWALAWRISCQSLRTAAQPAARLIPAPHIRGFSGILLT